MQEINKKYKFIIEKQGAPQVCLDSFIKYKSDNCIILYLELETKYCKVPFTSPDDEESQIETIIISCSEDTPSWKNGVSKSEVTLISCPNLKGWDIEFVSINKWKLRVAYLKKQKRLDQSW